MAKTITITNGVGSERIANGEYDVTLNAIGYNNSSINPAEIEIEECTNTYNFTVAAEGTLTLHVSEEGTAGGTPIVGATFVRTDSLGTQYGDAITSDSNGNAVFNNVPYDALNAPTIYFMQTASDGEHTFNSEVQSTTLTTQTQILEIQNELFAERTFNLTDANYANLPIESATITLD